MHWKSLLLLCAKLSYLAVNMNCRARSYHVCVHTCITVYLLSCWDFSCLMRPGHEKRKTWRENSWKEKNPLMILTFSNVAPLPSHFASLPYMCVNAYVFVSASKPNLHRQRSLPMSQLYHCLCLHPLFITNPLATCLYCQTVLLPCSVFSLESISLHHTSARLGKIAK